MKTPYAILIGLALIAAALFYRQPSITPAQAGILERDSEHIDCRQKIFQQPACVIFHGDQVIYVEREQGPSVGQAKWHTNKFKYR